MNRRRFVQQSVLTTFNLASCRALAAEPFPAPGKPIGIVVPYPPGGGFDAVARLVGQHLAERLRVPVVVENKPGGGSILGSQEVARSPADGHALLLNGAGFLIHLPHQMAKLPYDPLKDLRPIAQVVRTGLVLVAHPSLPVQDVKGLIDYARSNPGKLSYASWGVGGISHFYPELLKQRYGIDIVQVPYKGIVQIHPDLLENRVQLVLDATVQGQQMIRSGRLRALGVFGEARMAGLEHVPTLREQGIPGFDRSGAMGFFGPGALPDSVVERLQAELAAIVAMPEVARHFAGQGYEAFFTAPTAFAARLRADSEFWGPILKKLDMRLE